MESVNVRRLGSLWVLSFAVGCSKSAPPAPLSLSQVQERALALVTSEGLEPVDIVDHYEGASPAVYACRLLKVPWDALDTSEQKGLLAWSLAGIMVHEGWKDADRKQRNIWSKEGMDAGVELMVSGGFDARARMERERARMESKAGLEATRARRAVRPLD